MDSITLIADSISFNYSDKSILRGVYLELKRNCVCGLIGVNGSGKSTLFKILSGLLSPANGFVSISDKKYNAPRLKERFTQIAYLPQESFIPDDLSVIKIIQSFPNETSQLMDDQIIAKYLNQKIHSLSSGERRYLEIRLILSLNRQIVLLDEPFTGLEPIKIERVVQLIKCEKENGRAIMLTDHYHQYLSSVVDQCYSLNDGYCSLN